MNFFKKSRKNIHTELIDLTNAFIFPEKNSRTLSYSPLPEYDFTDRE